MVNSYSQYSPALSAAHDCARVVNALPDSRKLKETARYHMRLCYFRFNLIVLSLLIALAACGASPQVKKARYLESGDKFLATKQYKEAIIGIQQCPEGGCKGQKHLHETRRGIFLEVGDVNQSLSNLRKPGTSIPRTSISGSKWPRALPCSARPMRAARSWISSWRRTLGTWVR